MEKKPYFAVLLRHSIYAGMFMLSKAAFDGGMNNFIFVFYRQAIATVFLLPIALYFEWKTAPPLSFVTFAKIFMLSLFGITVCLDLQGVALIYTSASLAAATINAIPVITFLFALLFSLQCLVSSFQSFVIAIALERNLDEWKLSWNLRLLSVAYCGIVATGVTYSLQTWVIKKKGPVFLAMSTPIILVITTISSAVLLGESISLGSGIGGLLLIGGLYSVLWGKNKEQKVNEELKEIDKECSLPVRGN
ncbi:WAT1-related protein, partial [Cucurbita argyrosperma subsp. argyrosperma]